MEFDLNDQGDIGTLLQNLFLAAQLFLHRAVVQTPTFTVCQRSCLQFETQTLICSLLDMMGLKQMLERLGLAKTHLELKKMMSEVVGGASKDTISYHDFLKMMLGKRNAILKL